VAVVEVEEDLLGDVLRLGAIGDHTLRDRHDPAVLGDEEPLERVGVGGGASRFVAGHGLQHSGFHVTQQGTTEGSIVTPAGGGRPGPSAGEWPVRTAHNGPFAGRWPLGASRNGPSAGGWPS
jgi:hypothetical protein